MRNLFDQYDQPENRLSHALAICLDEQRGLLGGFLELVGILPPVGAARLQIDEQTLPGDAREPAVEGERAGLPDIVIHDDDSWCLLIESKVQAASSDDQLARHERTLRRRGFDSVECVTLTKAGARPERGTALEWSALYEWLGSARARGEWSERLRSYMRDAEVRLAREGYLTEGTLTMFDGFQFSPDNPYTYGEGKRLLKLAMVELRKEPALTALGVDPEAQGRGAITGRGGRGVWDFLSLTDRPKHGPFTCYTHLTLSVHSDGVEAAITIPNGVVGIARKRLADLGADGLVELNAKIIERAGRLLKRGGRVEAYAVQRHYRSQRSPETVDARVSYDLLTSQPRGAGRIKHQLEWVQLVAALLRRKRANIQFGYAAHLPWGTKGLDTRESLSLIVDSWLAMKPLLDRVRGSAS